MAIRGGSFDAGDGGLVGGVWVAAAAILSSVEFVETREDELGDCVLVQGIS